MCVTPEQDINQVIAREVQNSVQRLLSSAAIDAREVYLRIRIKYPGAEPYIIAQHFSLELYTIGLKYLIDRN